MTLESEAVRVEPVGESGRETWDDYVSHEPLGNLQQSWGWGELRQHYGWRVHRLAALRGADEWVGAIQILQHPWRAGPVRLHWGYAPQGPVLSSLADHEACRALLGGAAAWLRSNHMLQLKCDPEWPTDSPETSALLKASGLRPARFDFQHRETWLVDLTGGIDAVWGRLRSDARRNIRLSERNGVTVHRERGADAVELFYRLHVQTVNRQRLEPRPPLEYYQTAAEKLGAEIFVASQEGPPLAAQFAVTFGRKLMRLYVGTSDASSSARASYALEWARIKWGVENGCGTDDMWGMPRNFDPANPAHSYGVFKTRWGGRLVSYPGLLVAPVFGAADVVLHQAEAALLWPRQRRRDRRWSDLS
jgi:lipid II:glycine glycyltransferase (peptidoglycan interpeptide bridge formation enzyme)